MKKAKRETFPVRMVFGVDDDAGVGALVIVYEEGGKGKRIMVWSNDNIVFDDESGGTITIEKVYDQERKEWFVDNTSLRVPRNWQFPR